MAKSASPGIGFDSEGTYMRLIPLTEGGSIDLDDCALDEGVGSDKLVVRSVVDLKEQVSC
jgi:hypothetical protein